jgi:hypothetical protein
LHPVVQTEENGYPKEGRITSPFHSHFWRFDSAVSISTLGLLPTNCMQAAQWKPAKAMCSPREPAISKINERDNAQDTAERTSFNRHKDIGMRHGRQGWQMPFIRGTTKAPR